jgi:uncharacterized protein YcbK (DUF882 family)
LLPVQLMRPLLLTLILLALDADLASAEPLTVQIVQLQTGETLSLRPGRLPAPSVLNRFLRCAKDRRYTLMDPRLVAAAVAAARTLNASRVEILSAFRTSRLNGTMRAESRQVALRSRHINGQALDLRLPAVSIVALCDHFRALKLGGVGCYPGHHFVHIDVGPVRHW